MKFYIASDHAGFSLKEFSIEYLVHKGYEVVDLGPFSKDRVDYPDYAAKVSKAVLDDSESQGVLICGSGIGMNIMANRFAGVRAALAHDAYTASVARAHNDANILCYGERIVGEGVVESILDAWCNSNFEGGRHTARVEKLETLT